MGVSSLGRAPFFMFKQKTGVNETNKGVPPNERPGLLSAAGILLPITPHHFPQGITCNLHCRVSHHSCLTCCQHGLLIGFCLLWLSSYIYTSCSSHLPCTANFLKYELATIQSPLVHPRFWVLYVMYNLVESPSLPVLFFCLHSNSGHCDQCLSVSIVFSPVTLRPS